MKVYLIDGYAYVFRAYYSLPGLTDNSGRNVGAIYGFCNMLFRFIQEHKVENCIVVLDSGEKNFRHKIYSEYKTNRKELDEALKEQFPILREAIEAFNISSIEKIGYEADDIISAYSKEMSEKGDEVVIVSSDKDLLQLIGDNISIYDPLKEKFLSEKDVESKFEIKSTQLVDYFSLTGDASDNIPGAPGIGPKTASLLINEFGSLDAMYQNIDLIKKDRIKNILQENKEKIYLSKELVNLKRNYEDLVEGGNTSYNGLNKEKFVDFCKKYGFKSLINRVGKVVVSTTKYSDVNIMKVVECVEKQDIFTVYLTSTSIEISCSDDVNFRVVHSEDNILILSKILQNIDSKKVVFDVRTYREFGITNYEDISVIAYSISTNSIGADLSSLLSLYGIIQEVNSRSILELFNLLRKEMINKKVYFLYNSVDAPLVDIVYNMEKIGVLLDVEHLDKLTIEYTKELKILEEKIYKEAGKEFLVSSSKQLAEVLFVDMKLPCPKRGKSGQYSTDSNILHAMEEKGYKVAGYLLRWRHLSKLVNTYTIPLSKSAVLNRVHTTFILNGTSTGRFASKNPNLQNIPINSLEGKEIRKAFIAGENNILIIADYSQIELRLLAVLANVKKMKEKFKQDEDLHYATAFDIFHPVSEITQDMRKQAKIINFSIIYGISDFGLASSIGITRSDAKKYIDNYFTLYPEIKEYMISSIKYAKQYGYVKTIMGRRCHIQGTKSHAERFAINAGIQGSQADIIRKAMVNLSKDIQKTLRLQVHDELVFEVPKDKVDSYAGKIKQTMEGVLELDIPLKVDISISQSWNK